jgi:hypothetical protein
MKMPTGKKNFGNLLMLKNEAFVTAQTFKTHFQGDHFHAQ